MLAFAGNSLLCRIALRDTVIDAASFTAIRIASGALMLAVLLQGARRTSDGGRQLAGGAMLFSYAAFFSFAYRELSAATGALLLFGAVQMTMMGFGLFSGERLGAVKLVRSCAGAGRAGDAAAAGTRRAAAAGCRVHGRGRGLVGRLLDPGQGGSASQPRRPAAISCARCRLPPRSACSGEPFTTILASTCTARSSPCCRAPSPRAWAMRCGTRRCRRSPRRRPPSSS